uniref:5-hydroxytryptamine receptor 7 n=1 Tax=Mus musculus TaxID=10090 RepID=E9Q1X2_MOUSE
MMDVNSSGRPDLYGHLRSLILPEVGRRLQDLSPDGGAHSVVSSWMPHLLSGFPEVTASPAPTWDAPPDNVSGCGEQINYGRVEKVVIGSILTLITLLTIAGNCLVVISVCFVKKLRQPSNYLIVSLALADLSVAVAVMPFVSVTDLIGGKWIFGHFFCNVFIAMDVMCCTASIMTLCVISIDRYLGITRPLTYPVRQNGKCMAKMILSVWLLSASITLPPLFGWAQNVNDDKVCLISQDFGYTIYSTAVARRWKSVRTFRDCSNTKGKTFPSSRGNRKQPLPWGSSWEPSRCAGCRFSSCPQQGPLSVAPPVAASRCGWRGHVCGWAMQTLSLTLLYMPSSTGT